jgi:predicted nucleotidyltransferase
MTPPLRPPAFDPSALEAGCERLGVTMVVLFGSRASGRPPPGPDSDLDMAVSFDRPDDAPGLLACHGELADVFPGEALDLVFLQRADPLFRWEIMREGRLVRGDEMEFLEYRAFAYRDFVDSADLRALERTLFEKKLALIRRRLDGAT